MHKNTCTCPLNADDFETLADVEICGKLAVTTRVIEGVEMAFCAACLRAYETSVIEDAAEVGITWTESPLGVEIKSREGQILLSGQRPACIEWLQGLLESVDDPTEFN